MRIASTLHSRSLLSPGPRPLGRHDPARVSPLRGDSADDITPRRPERPMSRFPNTPKGPWSRRSSNTSRIISPTMSPSASFLMSPLTGRLRLACSDLPWAPPTPIIQKRVGPRPAPPPDRPAYRPRWHRGGLCRPEPFHRAFKKDRRGHPGLLPLQQFRSRLLRPLSLTL